MITEGNNMSPTGVGGYNGYPGSKYWNVDSRPLSEATNVLRSFVLQNIVQDNQWEIDRITKYYLYWKFYDGMHYKDFNDGLLSFNYVRAFVDKVNMYLLGNEAFTFNVTSYYSEQVPKEVERVAEELIMYHWSKSKKLQLAYEMVQMGGITGDCWVGVNWDEKERFCRISVFDSRQCFVKFKNGNYNETESFMVRQSLDPQSTKEKFRLFVTKYTAESVETWYQKDVCIEEKQIVKYNHTKQQNPLGFIPVVHIKNKPNSSGYYGKSDMNDILKVNKVYNEMMQQLKAIIDYYATPTTIITGASAKSLKRGLGQIWSGLPPEANVYNLGLDIDLSSATMFVDKLKIAMHELSDVPENALGKIQAISNTSAAALQITYHPLIQQANLKSMQYGEGITEINSMILQIMEIYDPKNKRLVQLRQLEPNFSTEMRIEPVFAFGFPKDKMDELNRASQELGLKLTTRADVMERLGKQNIPQLLEEIDNDDIHQAMLQVKINLMTSQMNEAMQSTPEEEEENGGEDNAPTEEDNEPTEEPQE